MRRLLYIGVTTLATAAGIRLGLSRQNPWMHHDIALVESRLTPSLSASRSQSDLFKPKMTDAPGKQSNILELPAVSFDFVGVWGGYTHTKISSAAPGMMTGSAPDRVSIVLARGQDAVFVASELYTAPQQRIIRGPIVRILNPRVFAIEYESADEQLEYISQYRFRLLGSAKILYSACFNMYERDTHTLAGTVTQTSTLKRIITAAERQRFAIPSSNEVPRAAVMAARRFPGTN